MLIPPSRSRYLFIGVQITMTAAAYLNVYPVNAEHPSLPAWEESGGGRGAQASLFPHQGDLFQGGTNNPEVNVPGSFFDRSTEAVAAVPAAASVAEEIVALPSQVGQFRPVGSEGLNRPSQTGLSPVIGQALGVGSVAGGLANGGNSGPFGEFIPTGNSLLQGIALIGLLQDLMNGISPVDGTARFDSTNTGQSAKSAFVNLMQTGVSDSLHDLQDPSAVTNPATPPSECGMPSKLTPEQQRRWDAQFERMNRLIKGSSLEGYVPPDGAKHGIVTGSSEEWAAFYANLGVQESGNQNSVVGDEGRFVGNSNGIFQLSPLDYANYRGEMEQAGIQPGTTIDGKPAFTIEQLQDPETNSRAALVISENLIRRDGAIGSDSNTGMARYWGPLRSGWAACA